MNKKICQSQQGFTLVELMITTSIFAVILLGATAAVIQVGRMYYKATVTIRTQETSRRVIDEISRSIQFSDKNIQAPNSVMYSVDGDEGQNIEVRAYCVGKTRYSFVVNRQVFGENDSEEHRLRHALWQDEIEDPQVCATNSPPGDSDPVRVAHAMPNLSLEKPTDNGRELLARSMRLTEFTVLGSTDPAQISVGVMYGDDDLLLPDPNDGEIPTNCRGMVQGAQWCAASTLRTQVRQRINPGE